jgi:hypothetical protein
MFKKPIMILIVAGLAFGGAALWAKAVDVTGD